MDLPSTTISSSALIFGDPSIMTCGVRDVMVSSQLYIPLSDVLRGDNERVTSSIETLSFWSKPDLSTIHVALASWEKSFINE